MSSQQTSKSAPILGHTHTEALTRPFCQLTITNTLTNQSKHVKFVVDTGWWVKHSIIKQEVLDDIGIIPRGTGETIRSVDLGTSCYHLTPFLAVDFQDKRILTAFNVNPRGKTLVFPDYDGLLGRNDIARLGIDIKLDKNCPSLPNK